MSKRFKVIISILFLTFSLSLPISAAFTSISGNTQLGKAGDNVSVVGSSYTVNVSTIYWTDVLLSSAPNTHLILDELTLETLNLSGPISVATATFNDLTVNTSISVPNDSLSGDDIDGGTISNFASTGIIDDTTGTRFTVKDGTVSVDGAAILYVTSGQMVTPSAQGWRFYKDNTTDLYLTLDDVKVTPSYYLDMNNLRISNIDWANSDDGADSDLDADLLDGIQGSGYQLQLTTPSWVAYDSNRLGGVLASGYTTDAERDALGASTGTLRTDLNAEISATDADFINVGLSTAALQSDVDSKQAELSTPTWVAADSNLLNGLAASGYQLQLTTPSWKAYDSGQLDGISGSGYQLQLTTPSWTAYNSARLNGEIYAHYLNTTTVQIADGKKTFLSEMTVSSNIFAGGRVEISNDTSSQSLLKIVQPGHPSYEMKMKVNYNSVDAFQILTGGSDERLINSNVNGNITTLFTDDIARVIINNSSVTFTGNGVIDGSLEVGSTYINVDTDVIGLTVDSEATSQNVVTIGGEKVISANILQVNAGDLTTGHIVDLNDASVESTTGRMLDMRSVLNVTADKTGSYVSLQHERYNAMNRFMQDDFNSVYIQRYTASNHVGSTVTATGSALYLRVAGNEFLGNLSTMSIVALKVDSTSKSEEDVAAINIIMDNTGTGGPVGIDMSSFSSGEHLFKFPASTLDVLTTGILLNGIFGVSNTSEQLHLFDSDSSDTEDYWRINHNNNRLDFGFWDDSEASVHNILLLGNTGTATFNQDNDLDGVIVDYEGTSQDAFTIDASPLRAGKALRIDVDNLSGNGDALFIYSNSTQMATAGTNLIDSSLVLNQDFAEATNGVLNRMFCQKYFQGQREITDNSDLLSIDKLGGTYHANSTMTITGAALYVRNRYYSTAGKTVNEGQALEIENTAVSDNDVACMKITANNNGAGLPIGIDFVMASGEILMEFPVSELMARPNGISYGSALMGATATDGVTIRGQSGFGEILGIDANFSATNPISMRTKAGNGQFFIATTGNIGISSGSATSNPAYLLTMEAGTGGGYYDVSDHDWHTGSSLEELKTEITDYDAEVLEMLKGIKIKKYKYKDVEEEYEKYDVISDTGGVIGQEEKLKSSKLVEPKSDKKYAIGYIAEEIPAGFPEEVITKDGHLSMKGAFSYLILVSQKQQEKIEALESALSVRGINIEHRIDDDMDAGREDIDKLHEEIERLNDKIEEVESGVEDEMIDIIESFSNELNTVNEKITEVEKNLIMNKIAEIYNKYFGKSEDK